MHLYIQKIRNICQFFIWTRIIFVVLSIKPKLAQTAVCLCLFLNCLSVIPRSSFYHLIYNVYRNTVQSQTDCANLEVKHESISSQTLFNELIFALAMMCCTVVPSPYHLCFRQRLVRYKTPGRLKLTSISLWVTWLLQ